MLMFSPTIILILNTQFFCFKNLGNNQLQAGRGVKAPLHMLLGSKTQIFRADFECRNCINTIVSEEVRQVQFPGYALDGIH